MSKLNLFQFKNKEVRTVLIDHEIWFVGKDVCDVLELSNPSSAYSCLASYEKKYFDPKQYLGSKSNQEFVAINESGLYRLIFKSRKTIAVDFQDWICQEVIPSIRKTGKYEIKQVLPPNKIALECAKDIREITDTLDDQPKLAQFLIDYSISHLISENQARLTGIELKGVTEISKELGFKVTAQNRSVLGRFCANRLDDIAVTEKRLVNGQLRAVKCYPDTEEVRNVISTFFS